MGGNAIRIVRAGRTLRFETRKATPPFVKYRVLRLRRILELDQRRVSTANRADRQR